MKIIVCIKQVPGTTKVDIDETTGVLKREGIETKMNPYDLYAVETALKIKEEYQGNVYALSMGPLQAKEVLIEALTMGVDEGVLLSDNAFAGSDVLATSYALKEAINELGFYDLVICGKQTTDGDTAQVGVAMAEFLDIPHVSNISKIISIKEGIIRVEMDMQDCVMIQDILLPCLITVEKDIYIPRLPSYKRKQATESKIIEVMTLANLADKDHLSYGLNGSPTQVEKVFAPDSSNEKIDVIGDSDRQADYLFEKLKELKFI